jgi:hypothetical protein
MEISFKFWNWLNSAGDTKRTRKRVAVTEGWSGCWRGLVGVSQFWVIIYLTKWMVGWRGGKGDEEGEKVRNEKKVGVDNSEELG